LVSLLVTAALAPLVRVLALRTGVMDQPNHRSSHSVPTPRLGGVACLGGILVATAFAQLRGAHPSWLCVGVAVALSVVGLADDHTGLPSQVRLLVQLVAGAVAGFALGGPWGALAGAVVMPCLVNAVNFMDGINGISGFTLAVWGATTLVVGLHHQSAPIAVLGGTCAGAALGFLPFNVPAARLFLGDGGSYLFGGLCGTGLLLGWAEGVPIVALGAPLAIYAIDTAATLVRRAARGEQLTDAHREHVYQQLTSGRGLPHALVATYAAASAGLVAVAWAVAPGWFAAAATVLVCALYLASPRLTRDRARA
jgi:UDP-N-acetylmuramyl pentapeptide phosphotransferase/UDP-N-acetylglucosamine-1-phosphate transferase